MAIHTTAVVDARAEIAATAEIGPYVVIDGPVKIGAGVRIYPGAYLSGWTEIGEGCEIHPNAVVGHLPQDFHFEGGRSFCRIGAGTIIRENASIHRGTQPESETIIGDRCFLLAMSHVAHNCVIGNGVKLYNNTAIAGHAEIGDNAIVSAYGMVHQFCRVGEYAFVSAAARIKQDLPPYMIGAFDSTCVGYNAIGLRRSGAFKPDEITEARRMFQGLFRTRRPFGSAVEALRGRVSQRTGKRILEFVATPSRLGIIRGRMGLVGVTSDEGVGVEEGAAVETPTLQTE